MPPVIARRYRPQSFEDVIGQEAIVRTLRNAVTSGRIAHGYIFSGHRGIGKTTVARVLAKALNCRAGDGPTPTPCQQCESCREILAGNAVDVIEIDAASNRGIDEIRALRERVRYRPARDRYKFFILDEAHQLTTDAFNALLKTLEEPPEWVVFVLATTEPEALPATIRSRCQHFAFRAVSFPVLRRRLEEICTAEQVRAEGEALDLIAEAGDGSVRDALSLLEQALNYGQEGLAAESVRALLGRVAAGETRGLLEAVREGQARALLERADALLTVGSGPEQICLQLTQAVRNALVARAAPDAPELIAAGESERALAAEAAGWFGEEELTRFLQVLLQAAGDFRHGQQARLHFELALMKMLHARKLTSVEEVLTALGGGGAAAAAPITAPAASTPRPAAAATPTAVKPAATAPAPATPASPQPSAEPTQAVRGVLERQGKASLLSILDAAAWEWTKTDGLQRLRLVYAPGDARAALAQQAASKKALSAACAAALGGMPEISVASAEGAPAAPGHLTPGAAAGAPGSAEERAERHPLLRQLREQVPMHVLRTRPLPPRGAAPASGPHSGGSGS
ncbi:MAG: DNA polymerase III subunit gamma/tau [Terriglobales bacterium]